MKLVYINPNSTRHMTEGIVAMAKARGVDVILDMVGGPYVDRNLQALADDGRCAVISLQAGKRIEADLNPLLRRRLTLTGSTLRPLPLARKKALARDVVRDVWPLIQSGTIRPRITGAFPLENAADAHRQMEGAGHMGKIVLTCR